MAETETDWVHALASAVSAWSLYPPNHPLAREPLSRFAKAAEARLVAGQNTTLLLVDDDLVLDGRAERVSNLYLDSLRRALRRARIERVTLLPGLSGKELEALIFGLAGRGLLEPSGHLLLGRVLVAGEEETLTTTGEGPDESHLLALEAALRRLAADEPRAVEALDFAVWQLLEAGAGGSRRFLLWGETTSPPATSSPATSSLLTAHLRHAVSVCLHTLSLGRLLSLGDGLLHDLGLGALLHDLGLWRMPAVLFDELAPVESAAAALALHPELGALRLAALRGVPEAALLIAYEHHRFWDGSGGYPADVASPGLGAQLVAVADVWDIALHRPGPWSAAERRRRATEELHRLAGRELNPMLVASFLVGVGKGRA